MKITKIFKARVGRTEKEHLREPDSNIENKSETNSDKKNNNEQMESDWMSPEFLKFFGLGQENSMSVATYFICLKMLSETMGKLPIQLYKEDESGYNLVPRNQAGKIGKLLRTRPNPYMTPTTFQSTMELNVHHYGNAYAWIRWNRLEPDSIWIMPSQDVEVIMDDEGIFNRENALWYRYIDKHSGKQHVFHSDNVIHYKTSTTFDGITGISVREELRSTIEGHHEAQKLKNNLYKNGLTAKAVLQYTSDLSKENRKKLIESIKEFANGPNNAGGIIPIPLGMTLQPLNIKLSEAQFYEINKFTALQIAAAFGIKPNHLNDYAKSSYANSESQNLAFYTETMLYIIKQREEEITYKTLNDEMIDDGYEWQFDVDALLRADSKTQMETLTMAVQNAIHTPNEARRKKRLPAKEGGDMLMANGNYIPLTMVGNQYQRGGDS